MSDPIQEAINKSDVAAGQIIVEELKKHSTELLPLLSKLLMTPPDVRAALLIGTLINLGWIITPPKS